MTAAPHPPERKLVKLAQLKFGHEHPFDDYNPRMLGRDAIDPALLADLRTNWVLQNVVGTTSGDEPWIYVFVGNRRLLHALTLAQESAVFLDRDVPVLAYADLTRAQAMDIAFAEEDTKMPLHAADQVVAFRRAVDDGKDIDHIADRFGTTRAIVLQRLALGDASDKVLDAWRMGEIDRGAVEAFTLAPDHKTQDKVLTQLRKSHCLQAAHIRGRLVPEQGDAIRLLNYVGTDAYEGAGGTVIKDLFHGQHGVSDPALLRKLAEDALTARAAAFVAEGWAWATPVSEMAAEWVGWRRSAIRVELTADESTRLAEIEKVFQTDDPDGHSAARIERHAITSAAELRGYSSRQKGKSGIVLRITGDGGLAIVAGVIAPPVETKPAVLAGEPPALADGADGAGAGEASTTVPVPAPEPRLSSVGVSRLADTLTDAAAIVLAGEPDLAAAVLLAGFHTNSGYGAVRVSHQGAGSNGLTLMKGDDFAKNLGRLREMDKTARGKLLAQVAAAALKFQAHSPERPALADDQARALVNALPPKKLADALHKRFDVDEYFSRATPTALIDAAIRECHGTPRLEAMKDDSRDAKNKFMLANLPDDWLPPELRWDGYAGPSARKATKKGARK